MNSTQKIDCELSEMAHKRALVSIDQYIDQNRAAITAYVRNLFPGDKIRTDDNELRLWLLNEEPLYRAMLSAGVDPDAF